MFFNYFIILSVVYVLASILYFFTDLPFRIYVAVSAIIPLIFLIIRIIEARSFIDTKLSSLIDHDKYSVFTKSLPGYRFVDIYNAVVYKTSQAAEWTQIKSQHPEGLAGILNAQFYAETNRRMNTAENLSRTVSAGNEEFFPIDSFWVIKPAESYPGSVIRIRTNSYTNEVILEVGTNEADFASQIIKEILEYASAHSIYKNKMLEVSFAQEVKDDYGDIERNEKLDLIFLEKAPVTENDIILDDKAKKVIDRCIVDFHERREELMKAGLPGRRGVLFYGPPGTGKTYTCRYISTRIDSATTIITSGMSLLHIKSICNIARMLQPAIVILEDVDLVYSSREQNVYNTALGELMNELDGFSQEDHIIFILTTNAIDRVETAIRERPGRISQCIYFDVPTAELRARYLNSLLARYDCSQIDMNELISSTKGATQAFLKEFVYRTVQIATETQRITSKSQTLLSNESFQEALKEMRSSAGRSGETIIGFQVSV
jgi:AAA+ superfamily predicted ATPase